MGVACTSENCMLSISFASWTIAICGDVGKDRLALQNFIPLYKSLCVMTGTFEALAILSTMITQSQKECLDQIRSLCQEVSHFVLQYRAKAMKCQPRQYS